MSHLPGAEVRPPQTDGIPSFAYDNRVVIDQIPYNIALTDPTSIQLSLPDPPLKDWHSDVVRTELRDLTRTVTEWPLIKEVLDTDSFSSIKLPTTEGWNNFARQYLHPLGATRMRLVQGEGREYTAEQLVDSYAVGDIPVASDPDFFIHDVKDHGLGHVALPDQSTRVFQQIAQLDVAMHVSDPEGARTLAIELVKQFDDRSMMQSVGFIAKPGDLMGSGASGLLTGLFSRLSYYPDILASIEELIEEPPELPDGIEIDENSILRAYISERYSAIPKIGKWVEWERAFMSPYNEALLRVLKGEGTQADSMVNPTGSNIAASTETVIPKDDTAEVPRKKMFRNWLATNALKGRP
jgi:hypothetical protein